MSVPDLAVADLRDVLAGPIDATADLGRAASFGQCLTDASEQCGSRTVVVVSKLSQLGDLVSGHDGMLSQLRARTKSANRVDARGGVGLASIVFANKVCEHRSLIVKAGDEMPNTSDPNAVSAGQLFEPEGYIYVLKFSSARVKVGFTNDIKARMSAHASHAKVHGIRIEEKWVSPFHKEARFNEKRLIGFCRSVAGAEYVGEYFTGVPFGAVVEFAATELPITRTTAAASKRERTKASARAERTRILDAYEDATRPGKERMSAALAAVELELIPLARWLDDPTANGVLQRLYEGEEVSRQEIWDALGKYATTASPALPPA